MKTIYIAGKIGDLPESVYTAYFQHAKRHLDAMGYTAVIPLDSPHDHDKTWASYMIEDLQTLIKCDEVAMLSNWRESPGAKIEHAFAQKMGKEIRYLQIP